MRLLVCGGRDIGNYEVPKFIEILNELKPTVIISGEARGFDEMAKNYAKTFGIKYEGYPANWKEFGKRAGYIRNKQMLDEGKPDVVVAFPGGKGTAMMVKIAKDAEIETIVVDVNQNPSKILTEASGAI